jgi:hypothetical protein
MQHLLRRNRKVLKWRIVRPPCFEVANELGTAEIWKDQGFLNNQRRRSEHWHRSLIRTDCFAHAIPSAGQVHRDVSASQHDRDLLEYSLALEHGLSS